MKKEIKYILFLILALVLAGLVYMLVTNSPKRISSGNTDIPKPLVNKAPTSTTTQPVYTKEITLEMMTSEEKKKMGISDNMKIQVLERSADGTISAYRVINEKHPVIDKYGN